jgi:hypothetical protein
MSPGERSGAEGVGQQTVVERPPPGLARGHFVAPAGLVVALGVVVVVVATSVMAVRLLRRSKR